MHLMFQINPHCMLALWGMVSLLDLSIVHDLGHDATGLSASGRVVLPLFWAGAAGVSVLGLSVGPDRPSGANFGVIWSSG